MTASSTPDPVTRYFAEQAQGYAEASARWPWAPVRGWESRAILGALGDLDDVVVWELGCGAGFYTRRLLEAGAARVVAVDAAPAMVAQLPRERVRALVGDAARVDPGERFTHVLSAGMLEFVADPAAVLAHVARYTSEGACFVLLTPEPHLLGRAYRAFHRLHGLEVGLFGAARMAALAGQTGWAVRSHVLVAPLAGVTRLERV